MVKKDLRTKNSKNTWIMHMHNKCLPDRDFLREDKKKFKPHMHNCMPNYACKRHNSHWLGVQHLFKASYVKFQLEPLKIFLTKVEKMQKTHL